MGVGRSVCLDQCCTLLVCQCVCVSVSAGESVLLRSDQVDGSGNVSIDMESVQRNQQLQQLEQQVCRHTLHLSNWHVMSPHTHTQDTYIQERAEAMENIHSTIVELGSIFKQLAEMVQEQEEQVVR